MTSGTRDEPGKHRVSRESDSGAVKITGFHLDDHDDWVAEFSCGHQQHMRHNPPWQLREWVTTDTGREEKLGTVVECSQCRNASD